MDREERLILNYAGTLIPERSVEGFSVYYEGGAYHFRISQYTPESWRLWVVNWGPIVLILSLLYLIRMQGYRNFFMFILQYILLGLIWVIVWLRLWYPDRLRTIELVIERKHLRITNHAKRVKTFYISWDSIENLWFEKRTPTPMSQILNYTPWRCYIQTSGGAFFGLDLKIDPGVDLYVIESQIRLAMGLYEPPQRLPVAKFERIIFEEPLPDNKRVSRTL